jgi:hypothetical protein
VRRKGREGAHLGDDVDLAEAGAVLGVGVHGVDDAFVVGLDRTQLPVEPLLALPSLLLRQLGHRVGRGLRHLSCVVYARLGGVVRHSAVLLLVQHPHNSSIQCQPPKGQDITINQVPWADRKRCRGRRGWSPQEGVQTTAVASPSSPRHNRFPSFPSWSCTFFLFFFFLAFNFVFFISDEKSLQV